MYIFKINIDKRNQVFEITNQCMFLNLGMNLSIRIFPSMVDFNFSQYKSPKKRVKNGNNIHIWIYMAFYG